MHTTVNLPDDLFNRLTDMAREEGRSRTYIIRRELTIRVDQIREASRKRYETMPKCDHDPALEYWYFGDRMCRGCEIASIADNAHTAP
jgi:hypothetical protein